MALTQLSLLFSASPPAALSLGTAYNYVTFGTVRVQVDGLVAGDTVTCAESVAQGGTAYPLAALQRSGGSFGTEVAAITANGTYQFPGGTWLTFTHNGPGAVPIITVSAAQ